MSSLWQTFTVNISRKKPAMKKLKLDLDHIQVVSFAIQVSDAQGRGTVRGLSGMIWCGSTADTDIGCGGTGGATDSGGSCRFCNPEPISADFNC